ncbi:MAG TPA: PKD domain-containing protein [Chitinophagaceae bacterium]|nr:PKD domain-containing protein [Chitinophagaceae bacterium]
MKNLIPFLLFSAIIAIGCNKNSASNLPVKEETTTSPATALSAKFNVTLTVNEDGVKEGDDIPFENQSTGGVSYRWDFSNGYTSSEKNPVFQFGCGTVTIKLTVTSANGTTSEFTKDLLVYCKGKNVGGKNADGHVHTGNTGE